MTKQRVVTQVAGQMTPSIFKRKKVPRQKGMTTRKILHGPQKIAVR